MTATHHPTWISSHPRVLLALGASVALHGAVLAGWRPFDIIPPQLSAFEPIEVSLVSESVPRTVVPPAPKPATAPAPAPASAPSTTESAAAPTEPEPKGEQRENQAEQPLVQARSDVASLNNPRPPYPLAARRLGLQGRVLLAVHVHAGGGCTEVKLKQSSGHALLDEAALQSVSRWRFLPARRGSQPVDSWVDVPVQFRLEG